MCHLLKLCEKSLLKLKVVFKHLVFRLILIKHVWVYSESVVPIKVDDIYLYNNKFATDLVLSTLPSLVVSFMSFVHYCTLTPTAGHTIVFIFLKFTFMPVFRNWFMR